MYGAFGKNKSQKRSIVTNKGEPMLRLRRRSCWVSKKGRMASKRFQFKNRKCGEPVASTRNTDNMTLNETKLNMSSKRMDGGVREESRDVDVEGMWVDLLKTKLPEQAA